MYTIETNDAATMRVATNPELDRHYTDAMYQNNFSKATTILRERALRGFRITEPVAFMEWVKR